jgi:hypothetical protein
LKVTGEGNNIDEVEAEALEFGDDGGEGVVGCRDVVVGALDAGTQRVPPPEWYIPVRATNLQDDLGPRAKSHT